MGALRLSMWVERNALHITSGAPDIRTSVLSSGRQRVSKVCLRCDTDLWTEPPERPKIAVLRPGTLVNYKDFVPVAHLFVRSALPWMFIPTEVARYDTKPDDPRELLQLWSQYTRKSGESAA